MSSNDDTIIDVHALTHDDCIDAYHKLSGEYLKLKENYDIINQKLHQEVLQRKTFENSLNDLQLELDSINEVHARKLSQIECKSEEYKDKNQQLIMANLDLENIVDEMRILIKDLENECNQLKAAVLEKKIKPRYSDMYSKSLELENENLRKNNHDLSEEVNSLVESNKSNREIIEELTETVTCMKDNLESKKAEIEEKDETIDQLQEKLHVLSSELALLKNSADQDENNRKGNSLFAEVDDQRQIMKKMLEDERLYYIEMKKAVNAREMEIRRLKRENLNIKSEIETCSNLLKRGEQLSSCHTRVYIAQLECEKQNLSKQLQESEQRLNDVLKEKKMDWVETVLTTTTKESRDLKDMNYVLLREKTLLAENHGKTLKDLSNARLESIKLKVLLGRIVNENKIQINEDKYNDIGIEHNFFENLRFEDFNEFKEEEANNENEMLNESTIVILGGRERLGNAVPKLEIDKISSNSPNNDEKENKYSVTEDNRTKDTVKLTSVKTEPFEFHVSPLKTKNVQFSEKITTKVIDSTKESLEASIGARKKPMVTVKRIIIPSIPKKNNSNNN